MKLRKKRGETVNLVSALLEANAQLDAVAHVDPLGVIERSRFIEVSVRAARWAEVVHAHGLARGEHIVVLAERDRAWRAALLGVIQAGCVAVPLPGTTPAEEILAVATDSGAALIVAPHARPDLDEGPAVASADEVDVPRTRPPANSDESGQTMSFDDPALVLSARGGGSWRGAVHTHGSLLAQAVAGEQWLGLSARDSVWSTAQDGSPESIWLLLATWHAGAEVIVVDQTAAPEVVLELLHRLHPSAVWLSDDEYLQLASANAPDWLDLRSIRRALTFDAQAPGVVAFHESFGTAVAPTLGSPEAGMVAGCAAESADRPAALRGIGLTVVDDEGRELRAGEVGELAIAGGTPSLFAGYGRERNGAPKAGEWFRIGRRGAIDPDGLLRLAPDEEPEPEEAPVADDDAGVAAHVAPAALVAEEQSRAREAAEAEERSRAEEKRRGEEAEQAQRTAEREAKERAATDERRRRDDEREREKTARAEEKRRGEEAKQAQRTAEREAKERAAAEERERRDEEKRRKQAEREEREAAKAAERRRAEEAKQHEEAEKRRQKEAERQREAAERERLETAAAEERRRAEKAEQAKREAAAAKEALRAEEAERAAREAEQKRRSDELLRQEEQRRKEERKREAERAKEDRLAPGIRSMIDHYGFAGAPSDPDGRREPGTAEQKTAFEDRATDSR